MSTCHHEHRRARGLWAPGRFGLALCVGLFDACAASGSAAPPAIEPLGQAAAPVAAPATVIPTAGPPASPAPVPARLDTACPEELAPARAHQDYEQAVQAIRKAGEHPMQTDLDKILPKLRGAARAGHVKAQVRYGSYVVGYFLTDQMFWPDDKSNAVSALAMLRVAARRDPAANKEWFGGLAKDPVELGEQPLSELPKAWVELALVEADAWERCHPELGARAPRVPGG